MKRHVKEIPLARLALVYGALLGVACRAPAGQIEADVTCTGAGDVVHCDVKETRGIALAEACWELDYTCTNGKHFAGSYCQEVKNGLTASHDIPVASIAGIQAGDQIETMAVNHLRLNVR